jgi:DNA-binding MarR family transcriptional regulator
VPLPPGQQQHLLTAAAATAASQDAVDAVLAASRSLVAVASQSLGGIAEETTLAQYRALVVLASRGPQRMVDLAGALGVTPSTAGRMCDRLLRKGLIWRHRARADRREVQVSITPGGRHVVDEATDRRRALLAGILGRMPAEEQAAVAAALRAFATAAGEVPDEQWPERPDGPPTADLPAAHPPATGHVPMPASSPSASAGRGR